MFKFDPGKNKGVITTRWRCVIRREFVKLRKQGIHKDSFSLKELSRLLGENEQMIHEALSSVDSVEIIYHTKDKILYLDPFKVDWLTPGKRS